MIMLGAIFLPAEVTGDNTANRAIIIEEQSVPSDPRQNLDPNLFGLLVHPLT
jgi:hypothetical protein